MEKVTTIKLENEQIRIVFTNEANPDEPELVMRFTTKKDGEKKITSVSLDNSLLNTEATFMNEMYMNTLNSLLTVKEIFDAGKTYEGLHVLTREEYKQYVIKVLGHKIEE